MAIGQLEQLLGDPSVVRLIEHQLGQRIASVGVETRRDDHQFGPPPPTPGGPSVSFRGAPNPAETITSSGRNASSAGRMRCVTPRRNWLEPAIGRSGTFTILPTPVSLAAPVPGYSGY